MVDALHEKYAALMARIEDAEDRLVELAKDEQAHAAELQETQRDLRELRNELTRLSDGCGHPRHHLS